MGEIWAIDRWRERELLNMWHVFSVGREFTFISKLPTVTTQPSLWLWLDTGPANKLELICDFDVRVNQPGVYFKRLSLNKILHSIISVANQTNDILIATNLLSVVAIHFFSFFFFGATTTKNLLYQSVIKCSIVRIFHGFSFISILVFRFFSSFVHFVVNKRSSKENPQRVYAYYEFVCARG